MEFGHLVGQTPCWRDTMLERRVYLKDNAVFLSEDARLFFTSSIGWSRKKFCCFPFFSYFLSYKVVRKGNKWHLWGLPFRTSFSGVLMGILTKMWRFFPCGLLRAGTSRPARENFNGRHEIHTIHQSPLGRPGVATHRLIGRWSSVDPLESLTKNHRQFFWISMNYHGFKPTMVSWTKK